MRGGRVPPALRRGRAVRHRADRRAGRPARRHGTARHAAGAGIRPPVTGSLGLIVVNDWDATTAMSAGTGCTSDGSAINNGVTYAFMRRTSADGVAASTTTLNVTRPATSTNIHWVYVEIVPASGAAAPEVARPGWLPALGPELGGQHPAFTQFPFGAGPAGVMLSADLAVTATLAAAAGREAIAAAALAASATLAAGEMVTKPIAGADVSVVCTLAAGVVREAVAVAAPTTVTATLSADATVTAAGKTIDAALSATATLSAGADREAAAAAALAATATLAAGIVAERPVAAALVVSATLAASESRIAILAAPA